MSMLLFISFSNSLQFKSFVKTLTMKMSNVEPNTGPKSSEYTWDGQYYTCQKKGKDPADGQSQHT